MPREGDEMPLRAIRAEFQPGDLRSYRTPIWDLKFHLREKGLGWWLRAVLTDKQLTGSHQLQLSVIRPKEILSQTPDGDGLLHFGECHLALHHTPVQGVDLRDDVWDVAGQNCPRSLIITSGKKQDTNIEPVIQSKGGGRNSENYLGQQAVLTCSAVGVLQVDFLFYVHMNIKTCLHTPNIGQPMCG